MTEGTDNVIHVAEIPESTEDWIRDVYLEIQPTLCVYPGAGTRSAMELSYLAMGLAGEAGETVDVLKKAFRKGYAFCNLPADYQDRLELELGDVLFYVLRICAVMQWDPKDILMRNLVKLLERKATGQLKERK